MTPGPIGRAAQATFGSPFLLMERCVDRADSDHSAYPALWFCALLFAMFVWLPICLVIVIASLPFQLVEVGVMRVRGRG